MTAVKCMWDMPRELASLRRSLDQDRPGWDEELVFCPACREEHLLRPREGQLSWGAPGGQRRRGSWLLPIPPGKPAGWCRWHRTASPMLQAPCAWCGTALHVHRDALGAVKSGRAGRGYLTERCPACHRENAVHPLYGSKPGIRTSRLEGGQPVVQMSMGGMR